MNAQKIMNQQKREEDEMFKMGYDDCIIEIMVYLIQEKDIHPRNAILQQLFKYLLSKRSSL